MKKILKNTNILSALLLGTALTLGACSEWTDTKSLEIKKPTIEELNPELYAQYLANLNRYKASDHKIVYVTFDNSTVVAGSRADHITIIPDSVDIISLDKSDNLTSLEIQQIEKVRTKGTKVIYTISYEAIQAQYDAEKLAFDKANQQPANKESGEMPKFIDFAPYLTEHLSKQIALCDKYNYDGITLSYNGKSTLTMGEVEKAEYIANQNIVLSQFTKWIESNKSKMLIFAGTPKHLVNRTVLASCKYIIIQTQSMTSSNAMDQMVRVAMDTGIPNNNIIVAVLPYSMDKDDTISGYFIDGSSAILSTSYWVLNQTESYTKAGIAILGIKSDYYNRTLVYKYTRGAIEILYPSAKN